MLDNINSKLTKHLGDAARLFEFGPFNEVLRIVPDEGGGGGDGDGSNGNGSYTARDKAHAHQLFSEGYQGNDIIDAAKAIAGIEGLMVYDTKLYNPNSRIQSIHARLMNSDDRDIEHYPIGDYATPGVHLLIRMIEESMDLDNPEKRASVILFGESGISKSTFLKAIIANMFGQGVIEVNSVEHIARVIHAIKPNVPLLLEDFHWRNTTNGAVVPISCVTGLLEQSNSNGKKEVMCAGDVPLW